MSTSQIKTKGLRRIRDDTEDIDLAHVTVAGVRAVDPQGLPDHGVIATRSGIVAIIGRYVKVGRRGKTYRWIERDVLHLGVPAKLEDVQSDEQ